MFSKTTLKNGLRIITVPQKETKAATILVMVKTGSKYEERETSGISHFLEHMLFKGTKKRKGPMEVAEVLDRVGGDYNAFTGEEYTGYYAKVDSAHFDIALDWVSDIFLSSKIPEEEIEKERGVIIEEINMYMDNPMMYIDEIWKTVLYGDQPAGWDTAGTKETVSNIKREQILDYIRSQYVSGNTVVCVAGNLKKEAAVSKVRAYFSKIKTTKAKGKPKVIEKQKEPQVSLMRKKTGQANLALGVRGYSTFHKDKYVLDIMGVVLGGMMSSRLFIEVREKLGAAYYVRTYNQSDTDTGALVTFAGVDTNKIFKVIETILKEYKKLTKTKVSDKELKKAKDYVKGKMVLGLESSDAQASFYGTQELLKDEILSVEEIFRKIDKVKSGDIMRVARGIFKKDKLNLAVIGPFKDEEQFKKQLKL